MADCFRERCYGNVLLRATRGSAFVSKLSSLPLLELHNFSACLTEWSHWATQPQKNFYFWKRLLLEPFVLVFHSNMFLLSQNAPFITIRSL